MVNARDAADYRYDFINISSADKIFLCWLAALFDTRHRLVIVAWGLLMSRSHDKDSSERYFIFRVSLGARLEILLSSISPPAYYDSQNLNLFDFWFIEKSNITGTSTYLTSFKYNVDGDIKISLVSLKLIVR